MAAHNKKKTGERGQKKNEMSEEASAKREEILKSNERETSGAHQSDVDGSKKKMRWRARNMWAFFKNETENGHERIRDNGNTRIIMPMN